jgi:uncharacterized phage protein (TIGR01671 family)
MNREIKFKFWNKKNSRFLQNDNNSIDKTIFDLWDWVEVMGTCTSFPMGDYVFVQCTGLTDKNKKEIYEGDILDFTARYKQTGPVEVIYYGASFGCVVTDDGGLKEFWDLSHIVQQHYPEIIGNIFEHSELLKTI